MSVAKRRRLSEKSASPVIQPPKNYLPVHLQFFASMADFRKQEEKAAQSIKRDQKKQTIVSKPVPGSKNSWADLRKLDEQSMKAFEKIQKNQKGKVTTDARKIQNNLTLQEQINKMKQSMKVQGILSKEELYKFPFPQPKVDPKTTAYYKNLQVDKKTQKATKAINSALLDATPIIGSLKAVKELVTGRDAVTGDKTSRLEAALGIFGGGFIRGATKATKAAKAAEEMSEVSKITKGTENALKNVDDVLVKPLGRGSTGRTVPNNLTEQLAMKQVMSNPMRVNQFR